MKASLFLMFAGAAFALSSCQEAATPTATEPVAPPAPPIKVSLEKNEIGSVVYGGGIAPESVDGKSLEIGKPNGSKFYWECDFNIGDNNAHYSHQKAKYTKTGANTAKVEYVNTYPGEQEQGVFNLKFTSPTGGIVIGKGVSFTLK